MEKHLEKVISDLLEGTKLRSLNWQPGDRKTEYRLCLKHGIIHVDSWDAADPFTGDGSDELVDITFFNSDGVQVDRYCFSKTEERDSYNELMAVYDAARRNHLKVEETLSGLFLEIEQKAAGK